MALVGVELETLVFEPDAQTTRPLRNTEVVNIEYYYKSDCIRREFYVL